MRVSVYLRAPWPPGSEGVSAPSAAQPAPGSKLTHRTTVSVFTSEQLGVDRSAVGEEGDDLMEFSFEEQR